MCAEGGMLSGVELGGETESFAGIGGTEPDPLAAASIVGISAPAVEPTGGEEIEAFERGTFLSLEEDLVADGGSTVTSLSSDDSITCNECA